LDKVRVKVSLGSTCVSPEIVTWIVFEVWPAGIVWPVRLSAV